MTVPETPPAALEKPGVPTWVKVLAGVAIALVVVFLVLHFTGLRPAGH